ncbi:MAG: PAAR domain-containing protein [Rhodocyclaceae bacterium]
MALPIVVVGDTTSHGGRVISGSGNCAISGNAIARKGDLVACPMVYADGRPHGVNQIIEGQDSILVDGLPVALHGHQTQCGCTLIGCGVGLAG